MGSYIEIHSIDHARNLERLARLPRSVRWRLVKSKNHGRLFFDPGVNPDSSWEVDNFSTKPNFFGSHDWEPWSFKLDARHQYLNALARDVGMAEQMCRPMIKFALLLSRESGGRVSSGIADSQGHDTICVAERGQVQRVKFCYGESILSVDSAGNVTTSANPYHTDGGTLPGTLLLDESERHFGYRLTWLNDISFPEQDPDEYELLASSEHRKPRRRSLAMVFLRLLLRGSY